MVDPTGVVLDRVCAPVREYLRARPDTVRTVVSGLIDDEMRDLFGKVCVCVCVCDIETGSGTVRLFCTRVIGLQAGLVGTPTLTLHPCHWQRVNLSLCTRDIGLQAGLVGADAGEDGNESDEEGAETWQPETLDADPATAHRCVPGLTYAHTHTHRERKRDTERVTEKREKVRE